MHGPEYSRSPATDRRVRRTRELLRTALLSLLLEKSYERVTIQEVLDRADVGRSTFYAHFRDKEDLLRSGLEELRRDCMSRADAHASCGTMEALEPLRAFFHHVEGHRELGKALKSTGGGEFAFRLLHEKAREIIRMNLAKCPECGYADMAELEAGVHFLSGALMGLVDWWLDSDVPYSGEEVFSMFSRLAGHGLRAGRHT